MSRFEHYKPCPTVQCMFILMYVVRTHVVDTT